MTTPAGRAVEAVRTMAERPGMGTIIPVPLFASVGTSCGFGLSAGAGLTLVHADNTGPGWSTVFIACGLALDVPDPDEVLRWVNLQNRRTQVGKFYCAVAQAQNMTAVVYEHSIWGGHFEGLLDGPHGPGTFQRTGGWIIGLLKDASDASRELSAELTSALGGRPFPPDDNGLITLFTICAG